MAGKNSIKTSSRIASKAAKALASRSTPKSIKPIAASALVNKKRTSKK